MRKLSIEDARLRRLEILFAVVVGVVFAFCFVSFNQRGDLAHTVASSFTLLNGHFLDFYVANVPVVGGNDYPLPIYLLFALWNLPLLLLRPDIAAATSGRLALVTYDNGVMLYEKALSAILFLACMLVVHRLVLALRSSRPLALLGTVVFATSLPSFYSPLVFAQYDAAYVLPTLLGVLALVRGRGRTLLVPALWFGLAASFKPFPLILFLPMLLILEKNLLKVAGYSLLSAAPYFLLFKGLLFAAPPLSSGTKGTISQFSGYFFELTVGNSWHISLFAVALALLCGFCYFRMGRGDTDVGMRLVVVATTALGAFFAFGHLHPQSIMILAPFLSITCVLLSDRRRFYALDAGIAAAFMSMSVSYFGNQLGSGLVLYGILPRLGLVPRAGFSALSLFRPAWISVFATAFVALLVVRVALVWTGKPVDATKFRIDRREVLLVGALFLFSTAVCVLPVLAGFTF